jgi:type IV conjugative transfer system coupling protein TraD
MSTESNYKHYTRGGQISFHNLRMWDQITKTLLYCCLGIWFLASGLITWLLTGSDRLIQAAAYYYALFLNIVGMTHTFELPHLGRVLRRSVHDLVNNPYYARNANACFDALIEAALIGGGLALILGTLVAVYFIRKGKFQAKNQFIRGTSIKPSATLKKQIIRAGRASDLNFDGFPLIKDCEVQHLLVHGTVGMGKSQLIMKLMDGLRARGDRVIVYDKGCTFTENYFQDSSDVLLNPFDARCANWDLWAEAPRDELLENMAESLIPMHGESDPFWVNAARTVLSSAASKMRHDPDRSLEKLLQLLVTGEFTELEPYLTGTAAATLVSQQIEKTAISIRSVITFEIHAVARWFK